MKMYILILDDVEHGFTINSAAHLSLMCFLKYEKSAEMQTWLRKSFRKVSCRVTREELEAAKTLADNFVIFKESKLHNKIMGAAFAPRQEWHPFFKTLELWK